jgi:hypothetical protein
MNQNNENLMASGEDADQTVPSYIAAPAALAVSRPVVSGGNTRIEMTTRINESDTQHMDRFPAAKKARVMEKIMSLAPLTNAQCTESHHFEKTMMRLRKDGFELIDIQPLETALTTVWYRRKGRFPLGRAPADVTMVLWEAQDEGDTTTVMTWRV